MSLAEKFFTAGAWLCCRGYGFFNDRAHALKMRRICREARRVDAAVNANLAHLRRQAEQREFVA